MSNKYKLTCLMLFFFFTMPILYAQVKPLIGVVKDVNGKPVPAAAIVQTGTKRGISSDENGRFSLVVSSTTAKIMVSSVGFKPQEIMYSDSVASVILEEDASNMS